MRSNPNATSHVAAALRGLGLGVSLRSLGDIVSGTAKRHGRLAVSFSGLGIREGADYLLPHEETA
jgi:hypothetical protein